MFQLIEYEWKDLTISISYMLDMNCKNTYVDSAMLDVFKKSQNLDRDLFPIF